MRVSQQFMNSVVSEIEEHVSTAEGFIKESLPNIDMIAITEEEFMSNVNRKTKMELSSPDYDNCYAVGYDSPKLIEVIMYQGSILEHTFYFKVLSTVK